MGRFNFAYGITHKEDLSWFELEGCGDGAVTGLGLFCADARIKPVAE